MGQLLMLLLSLLLLLQKLLMRVEPVLAKQLLLLMRRMLLRRRMLLLLNRMRRPYISIDVSIHACWRNCAVHLYPLGTLFPGHSLTVLRYHSPSHFQTTNFYFTLAGITTSGSIHQTQSPN